MAYAIAEARREEDRNRSEEPFGFGKRSENPNVLVDRSSGNLLEGRGESMLCSGTDLVRNCQVSCEKIEQRGEGPNILHAFSSEYDLRRKHHFMSLQNSPQEETLISKRRRFNAERGENLGLHEGENVAAADQSDSTMKGSDLTAERMAEGSSRTTSSSENNGKLDPPPTAATNLSSVLKEKLKGTCLDSGLLENISTSIDDGQTVHRSEGFCSSSRPASGRDDDWLALGLDCGYRSHEPKPSSNKLSLDMTNKVKGSIARWNKDKDTEEQRRQQMQMLNSGHAVSKLTTLIQPSYPIQPSSARQLSFHSTRPDITNYSNARPLLQGPPMANRISFQKNITDSSNFSALNLLQPCTMEDQQNSQNTAVFPSVEQNFLYQRHTAGISSASQIDAASRQGFYDRISEARIPGRTDLCFSDPRLGPYKDSQSHRFSQGWRSLIAGTSDAYRNSEADSLVCASLAEKDILEKMRCRTQWNTRDNLSAWYNPGTSLGSLIRPNASEIASRRFPTDDRTLPLRQLQHQQYERHALPQERSMADPAQRFPGATRTENTRIFKPSRAAQTGVWFVLQASNNQNGDRMLPQIPRNYLRIKDGTMTILVVKKYLANKLGLNSESEIEIMCRGQKLLPSLTVQHVRDVMWPSTLNDHDMSRIVESNPSSTDHLMVLHYQRNNRNPAADAQF